MKMDINTEYTLRLSLSSLEEYTENLKKYKTELVKKAENIVRRVSEVGLENNYESAVMVSIVNEGTKITGGIKTTDEKDTYREFGTGIVGSENPHPDIMNGWLYDVNEHGEKGWIYPKEDGTFGWTKGVPAQKRFYYSMNRMEHALPSIAQDEFKK